MRASCGRRRRDRVTRRQEDKKEEAEAVVVEVKGRVERMILGEDID